MRTKWMLVAIGALFGNAVTAPPAQSADLQPMFFNVIRGELAIQQDIPCGNVASQTIQAALGLPADRGADLLDRRLAVERVLDPVAVDLVVRDEDELGAASRSRA